MAKEVVDFWNSVKDYDKEIISVFLEKNILTNEIKKVKKESVVADFGCGVGNSFKFLRNFSKIYAIDNSTNMLEKAKKKERKNVTFIQEDIKNVKLPEKVDLLLAISSVVPTNFNEFYEMMDNIVSNTKKDGDIFLTFSSFESRILSLQFDAEFFFERIKNPSEVMKKIKEIETKENFSSLGYMKSHAGLVQKQWLKEELEYKLKKYNFQKVEVNKLELNWKTQIKAKSYNKFPNLWMWFVKIRN